MRIPQIDFMGQRRLAMTVSVALVLIGVAALALRGLSLGLDFTGGVLVEVGFERDIQPEEVRLELAEAGYEESVVQNFGSTSTLLIRMPTQMDRDQAGLGDSLLAVIRAEHESAELRRIDFIGPVVGEELREQGGMAVLVALGVVMLYIMFRFTGKFSVGAVVALIHDVVIAVGAFAMFGWSFDLSVLAAMLAVIGYSLNDTIVVSDRIRENFRLMRRSSPIEVINASLNQTLGRTLVTSLTTLLVLVSLLVVGGEQLRGFATALTIGVIVGSYSSIYMAATTLLLLKIDRASLVVPEKESSGA